MVHFQNVLLFIITFLLKVIVRFVQTVIPDDISYEKCFTNNNIFT